MNVCVQFPNLDEPPVGIWWDDNGVARAYYAETGPVELLGRQVFAERNTALSLDDFFTTLSARTPHPINWEKMTVTPGLSPEEYLDMLRRVAVSQLAES